MPPSKLDEVHSLCITINNSLNARGGIFDRLEVLEKDQKECRDFRVATKAKVALISGLCGGSIGLIIALVTHFLK